MLLGYHVLLGPHTRYLGVHVYDQVTEQLHATTSMATDVVVPISVQFYNLSLFGWEPLVEPFEVTLGARGGGSGGMTMVEVRAFRPGCPGSTCTVHIQL